MLLGINATGEDVVIVCFLSFLFSLEKKSRYELWWYRLSGSSTLFVLNRFLHQRKAYRESDAIPNVV